MVLGPTRAVPSVVHPDFVSMAEELQSTEPGQEMNGNDRDQDPQQPYPDEAPLQLPRPTASIIGSMSPVPITISPTPPPPQPWAPSRDGYVGAAAVPPPSPYPNYPTTVDYNSWAVIKRCVCLLRGRVSFRFRHTGFLLYCLVVPVVQQWVGICVCALLKLACT